jgi:AcrR family transcriptional regulator
VPSKDDAPEAEGLWTAIAPEAARKLLLAALDSFATHGYNATTTRMIAQRVGMSPAGLYSHYSSKEELLYTIALTGHEMLLAEIEAALDGLDDPAESVQRFSETMTRWHARHHRLARATQYELRNLARDHFEEIRSLRHRFEEIVHGLVTACVRSGQCSVDDVGTACLALLSLSIDVARWYDPTHPGAGDLGAGHAKIALRIVGCCSNEPSR